MTGKTGVLICGHGSRSQAAVDEFADLVKQLPAFFDGWPVAYGYLEFANPVIRDGLDELRRQGCGRILAVPAMLFAAMHAKNDIPSVLNTYGRRHSVKIEYGRELGVDPKMIRAAADRITDAVAAADARSGPVPLAETCLAVIGRGASDPDANANVAKIARMLTEGLGFGWCETGYSGVTFPLVGPCLDHAAKLGYRRIVVFPYFLFTGVLVERIYGFTDMAAEKFPDIEFIKAGYLNDHPLVLETFAERVTDILGGENAMNCALCKYRTQIPGFESEIGLAQESHHHHVEGQGAQAPGARTEDCALCDTFCTGACRVAGAGAHGHSHDHGHGHDHHHPHPPYPQAAHPHGPNSVLKHAKQP